MLKTGMVLKGRYSYRILAKTGSGGVSDVWLAGQGNTRIIRALKAARPDAGNDAMVRSSFSVEKYVLRSLHMRDIPRLRDAFSVDGLPVLVLDYVSGMSMDRYLRENGLMSEEHMIPVIMSICRILRKMHAKGMVYRDLKPSNVMMRNDGGITLIDFGSVYCRKSPPDAGEMRRIGTPGYAAPELYHAEKCPDQRADIYSLGALMQSMCRGGEPEYGHGEGRLSGIIGRCLSEDPDDRYNSVDELIRDLRSRSTSFHTGQVLSTNALSHIRKISLNNNLIHIRKTSSINTSPSPVIFWHRAMRVSLAISGALAVAGLLSRRHVTELAEIRCGELIRRAGECSDTSKRLDLLNQAVKLPGCEDRDDIRLGMIHVCGEDGKLSEDEVDRMEAIGRESGAEIAFEIGRLYWYCSTCDEEDQRERACDAADWFERACGDPTSQTDDSESNNISESSNISETDNISETRSELTWKDAAEAYRGACAFYRYVASDVGDRPADGAYLRFAENLAELAAYEAGRTDGYAAAVQLADIVAEAGEVYGNQFQADGVTVTELRAIEDQSCSGHQSAGDGDS